MAYTGQIYYNNLPITIAEAISRNLVYLDEDLDMWLLQDSKKTIKINGDLHLTGEE